MGPEELREFRHTKPFAAFRIVMTDGQGFDVRHPELLMVGERSATVGLPRQPDRSLYERTIKVDLRQVVRVEPLPSENAPPSNGHDDG